MNTRQFVKLWICLLLILLAAALSRAQEPEVVIKRGHMDSVHSVACSPKGNLYATASEDKTVKLWTIHPDD